MSTATVYSLVASGKLRCVRIGNRRGVIRILDQHIEEFLRGAEPVVERPASAARQVKLKHLNL